VLTLNKFLNKLSPMQTKSRKGNGVSKKSVKPYFEAAKLIGSDAVGKLQKAGLSIIHRKDLNALMGGKGICATR
jgi:hypothetical protein